MRRKIATHRRNTIGDKKGVIVGFRRLHIGNNLRLGVHQQSRLGEGFVAIAKDGRNPSVDTEEGGKYRKLFSLGRHRHSNSRCAEYRLTDQRIEETEILMLRRLRILLLDMAGI